MMVTFVSECEKKALNKTRRVLDAFANRIGQRTWQTVITQQGLDAVKKLLRQTATKNTAVSCHWIRSRSRSELVWLVGNRSKFNVEGSVSVNSTQKNIMDIAWENDWQVLPLIKSLAAVAALFHDWGKASELFQTKLNPLLKAKKPTPKGDPVRHEWISVLFLQAIVNGQTDEEWLKSLHENKIDSVQLIERVQSQQAKPFKGLPPIAESIAWLILSHHRMPVPPLKSGKPQWGEDSADFPEKLLSMFSKSWGYENNFEEIEFKKQLPRCFDFTNGLPCDAQKWQTQAKKWAGKLALEIPVLKEVQTTDTWRLVLSYARQSLMLGDHYFSSLDKNPSYQSPLNLFANTYRDDNKQSHLKQYLDEHLLGVTKAAVSCANMLPMFESKQAELLRAYDLKALKQASPPAFKWQDKAVTKINQWRSQRVDQNKNSSEDHFGFFTVNMASTGKGKTFANAKIMRSLSPNQDSLRYVLALGLRTLTLQTGSEYRKKIKLGEDELAVLIGSRAVLSLHQDGENNPNKNLEMKASIAEKEDVFGGSYSEESLLDYDAESLVYDGALPESHFKTILSSNKDRQFLHAPVLVCTIDHLMAATETSRGGRYILPVIRLMSSDLVIDEIDDFDGEDAQAIGRLVHLAGMLGRKVMIASATISPDIAEGYFNTYQAGWAIFAKLRQKDSHIGCAWVDEFTTQVKTVSVEQGTTGYEQHHQTFVNNRVKKLKKEPVKRQGNIVKIPLGSDIKADDNRTEHYYQALLKTILEAHQHHAIDYLFTEKGAESQKISFGVVRLANVTPCVNFTRFLLNCDLPEEFQIKTMAYHSRQVLIMRHAQEKHLDEVLKRNGKAGEMAMFDNDIIQEHIQNTSAKNILFVLVATPVEEVGRDHDFDWAVVEPSSYRSIIQLAGRVRRHRDANPNADHSNVRIMQTNLKGFKAHALENDLEGGKPRQVVFNYPGYESKYNKLVTHDMCKLIDSAQMQQCLDATPRILKPSILHPAQKLADLEHRVIQKALTDYKVDSNGKAGHLGPKGLQGWLQGAWWLTASSQYWIRFRRSRPEITLYLLPYDFEWKLAEKTEDGFKVREVMYNIKKAPELSEQALQRLWLSRDYEMLLKQTNKPSIRKAAEFYGEINMPEDDKGTAVWVYDEQLGLFKE